MSAGLRLNAVTLGVADVARSASFYEQLGWRQSTISTPAMAVLTAHGSAVLIVHRLEDLLASAKLPSQESGFGGVALVMVVNSPEEVHTTLASAVKAGAKVLRPVTQLGHGSHAYFSDYDRHVWEVLETPGFALDDSGLVSMP